MTVCAVDRADPVAQVAQPALQRPDLGAAVTSFEGACDLAFRLSAVAVAVAG